MQRIRIGTRGSELALFQANAVAALLAERAGARGEIVVIKTSGDRLAEATLAEVGGKRLFVKEIEDALLAGEIDLAVHSSKDMPASLPEGLEIGAVLAREDPLDAIVLPSTTGPVSTTTAESADALAAIVSRLGRQPRLGTSSVRRVAQLRRLVPGARFLPIRGNLNTRLRKLDSGDFDALALAAAGLRRLGRSDRIAAVLPVAACVPAPGQGIIAAEVRSSDARMRAMVSTIDDAAAAVALRAERAVVVRLGGGCQMPIGALAEVSGESITLTAAVISPDGARAVKTAATASVAQAEALGVHIAERLLADGAGEILAAVHAAHTPVEGLQP